MAVDLMQYRPPTELLPIDSNQLFGVNSLSEALSYVHRPPIDAVVEQLIEGNHPYQQRLAFEELLAHNLAVQESRILARRETAADFKPQTDLQTTPLAPPPFKSTNPQLHV